MEFTEEKICVFIHYSEMNTIPNNIQIYVNELSKFFTKVELYTNYRKIKTGEVNLNSNVTISFEENEGYDLGFFYKYFKKQGGKYPKQIACINDSNYIVDRLDLVFNNKRCLESDFWGIIDSEEKPWFSTHKDNYHIQSHFMIMNKSAIVLLDEFFEQMVMDIMFSITNSKELRRKVINDWEIGLTQFFIKKGLSVSSFIESKLFIKKVGKKKIKNASYELWCELLNYGYPLIKRKVLIKKKSFFNRNESDFESVVRGTYKWDVDQFLEEIKK